MITQTTRNGNDVEGVLNETWCARKQVGGGSVGYNQGKLQHARRMRILDLCSWGDPGKVTEVSNEGGGGGVGGLKNGGMRVERQVMVVGWGERYAFLPQSGNVNELGSASKDQHV